MNASQTRVQPNDTPQCPSVLTNAIVKCLMDMDITLTWSQEMICMVINVMWCHLTLLAVLDGV